MSLAIVFPGQGSQSLGMLAALAQAHDSVTATFEEASRVLGHDLWKLVQSGPESELNATERTQPAMLAAGVAVWRVWNAQGGRRPALMAGHSLGEYTALVCAGAIEFRDAVALVAERGRRMQQAVPDGQGAMAAILGIEDEPLRQICARCSGEEVVSCANFNAPGQVVIAGHRSAVERAIAAAREAGAKRAVLLPVSVPSHCLLMKPAAERFDRALRACPMQAPGIAVLHNVDAAPRKDPGEVVQALSRQLYSPVRWVETVRRIALEGVRTVVECGPGKVLAGLGKRIDKDLNYLPIVDPETLQAALAAVGG